MPLILAGQVHKVHQQLQQQRQQQQQAITAKYGKMYFIFRKEGDWWSFNW
jgi:hypothetical protein